MKTYKVTTKNVIYEMSSKNTPAIEVEDGAKIVFETYDCFENQIQSENVVFEKLDWERINPATGPVFVKGAMPGDTLVVEIEDIKISSQGVMITGPNLGVIGDRLKKNSIKILPIINDEVVFSEKIKLPVKPMVGVIGTAPNTDSISCGIPGFHGGNMDSKVIGVGSVVYLPVEVAGGLLALGDVHAVMGDGEVSVCGAEVPAEVTIRVSIIKGRPFKLPVVKTAEAIYTIASAKTLDLAAEIATKNMIDILVSKNVPNNEAIALLSVSGNLQICQVVDPLRTARFELPLWIYNTLLN